MKRKIINFGMKAAFFLLLSGLLASAGVQVGDGQVNVAVEVGGSASSSGFNEHVYVLSYPDDVNYNLTSYPGDWNIEVR